VNSEGAVVQVDDLIGDQRPGVAPSVFRRLVPKSFAQEFVLQEAAQSIGQRLGVGGRNMESGLPVAW
jgi:hypothetical protein